MPIKAGAKQTKEGFDKKTALLSVGLVLTIGLTAWLVYTYGIVSNLANRGQVVAGSLMDVQQAPTLSVKQIDASLLYTQKFKDLQAVNISQISQVVGSASTSASTTMPDNLAGQPILDPKDVRHSNPFQSF